MAGKGLPPVPQLSRPRAPKPKEPERDFAPPPPYPVVWVVMDQQDTFNRRETFAQTAYKAFELSRITRDGLPLSYGECHVYHSEYLSKKGVDALVDGLQKLCAKPTKAKKNSKLNGKANGHAG